MNTKLHVITPIFNPFNFASRYRLYERFKKHMADCGVALLTVEAAFGDQPFRATESGNPWNVQLRTNQVLWHKERLINIGLKRLAHIAPDANYFGWIDADVTFANHDWVSETTHLLSHLAVVQPFATAVNLDSREDFMWSCPSSMRSFVEGRGYHQEPPMPVSYTYKGHPGLAWCARRDVFDRIGGLYDCCIAGSADTVMSNAFKGDWSVYLPGKPSKAMMSSMANWAMRSQNAVRGAIGYARGTLLHHWHGKSESRGYEKRWDILSFHRFDPSEDLAEDANGMHKWAGNKPRLEDDIRYSLSRRNEDEL